MPRIRVPRRGSMQFWPRKRAKRIYPRIRHWHLSTETKLLGFAGYKAGMSHVIHIDNRKSTKTKGLEVSSPITIIECPPIKVASIRFYKKTLYGLTLISEILHDKLDKELERKILIPKKIKQKIEDIKDFDEIRALVYTQPKLTSIGKIKPEVFEIGIGGKKEDKLNYAKSVLGKEVKITDIFKIGQQIDTYGVSKGKGLKGPIKRFGVGLKAHKSEKGVRRVGTLGGWKSQGHFMYRVAHAGQTGYHQRMEMNKWILKISDNLEEINPKGGFDHYGNIKNTYMVLKGSIIGPTKRMIRFTFPQRQNKHIPSEAPVIQYINIRK